MSSTNTSPAPLRDPRELYPRPPFPIQSQPVPGLASKMDPRPDHGEESYRGSGRLQGRKALITGADSGIGRAVAIAYAREGADLVLNYLEEEEPDAREVIELAKEAGVQVSARPGDLSQEAFCEALVAGAVDDLGGLDLVVQVAGKQRSVSKIADLTSAQFEQTMRVNVHSLFWITKAAFPHLPPGASMINTASVQAYDPSAHLLDYATTKAAIVAFSQAFAAQAIERGVRVNVVAPGPFWTVLQPSGGQPPEAVQDFGTQSSLGRPGQPAEIAPVYVHLGSTESSYTTGEVYGVTGGSPIA